MNLKNIFTEIEKTDPEIYDRLDTRRNIMKGFGNLSGKLALAAVPLALSSLLNKAYAGDSGQRVDSINDVLNYALTLEYLEAGFYNSIVGSPGYLTASATAQAALSKIADDENKHVAFLQTVLGAAAVPTPTFDFTGGNGSGAGPFAGYLNSYAIQLAMAQTFEDTGVRAYKGQATALMSDNDILTAALNIHSVEARHASHIRQMRRALGAAGAVPAGVDLKPYITLNQSGIAAPFDAAVAASYAGEEATTQATLNLLTIGGMTFTAEDASAAFDETLDMAQVLAIVDPFIV
ncbi:MAG: ferritin-like domain-containing protein [Ferruginibacter sp.]